MRDAPTSRSPARHTRDRLREAGASQALTSADLLSDSPIPAAKTAEDDRRPRSPGPVHQRYHRAPEGGRNHQRATEHADPRDRATVPRRTRRPPSAMMCVPFFHVGGSLGMLGSLYSGNTSVVQERFDAAEWLRLVQEHRVRTAFLVPTMLQRILDHPDFTGTDLSFADRHRVRGGGRAGRVGAPRNGRAATCRFCQCVWPDRDARRLHNPVAGRSPRSQSGWARSGGRCPALKFEWWIPTRAPTSRRAWSASCG